MQNPKRKRGQLRYLKEKEKLACQLHQNSHIIYKERKESRIEKRENESMISKASLYIKEGY